MRVVLNVVVDIEMNSRASAWMSNEATWLMRRWQVLVNEPQLRLLRARYVCVMSVSGCERWRLSARYFRMTVECWTFCLVDFFFDFEWQLHQQTQTNKRTKAKQQQHWNALPVPILIFIITKRGRGEMRWVDGWRDEMGRMQIEIPPEFLLVLYFSLCLFSAFQRFNW